MEQVVEEMEPSIRHDLCATGIRPLSLLPEPGEYRTASHLHVVGATAVGGDTDAHVSVDGVMPLAFHTST